MATKVDPSNRLGQWILEQRTARNLSGRAFAELCGVSYETINKMMRNEYGDQAGEYPSIPILTKIAAATNVTVGSLVDLLVPKELSAISSDTTRLALLISRLPENDRMMIENFISGAMLRASNQPGDQE